MKLKPILRMILVVTGLLPAVRASAFEGHIDATLQRGSEEQTWHYTIATNCIRIARGETNRPYAKNLIARDTGDIMLLFPHNRSFVRLKPTEENAALQPSTMMPDMPQMSADGGMMPTLPMMAMPGETIELKATGETTNLLGYACIRYEIRQRGELMEIWATEDLIPFQTWLSNQPSRGGPRMIEEQWARLLQNKKLFPLLAVLKYEHGPERLRFTVTAIQPEVITDPDGKLLQPPPEYREIRPLPF